MVADPGTPGAPADQLLLLNLQRNGNDGTGTPEPLRHDFSGNKLTDGEVRIAVRRYHYG